MQYNIINPDEVKTQLQSLSTEIQKSDRKAANRLDNLRVAVGGGNNADAWAMADIEQLINPEQIVAHYNNQPQRDLLISFLEVARNCIIFLPLLFSWFVIWHASATYSAFLSHHKDQVTQPFLLLWQTGFGNQLSPLETLSGLATIDTILLTLLVLLTIIISVYSDLSKQHRLQKAEALRVDLTDALAGARLCLATRNQHQPGNYVDTFDKSSKYFKDAIENLLKRIEDLANAQRSDHQVVSDLSKNIAGTMGTVVSAVNTLKTSTDTLGNRMNQLAQPVNAVSNTLGVVSSDAKDVVKLQQSQLTQIQTILDTQNTWSQNFHQTLLKVDTAINAGAQLASSVDTFTRRDDAIFNALSNELRVQSELVKDQKTLTTDLGRIAADIHGYINRFNQMLVLVDEFNRRLHTLTQKLPVN